MSKVIRDIFSEIPHTYELVNHFLTFGLDILWRRTAAKQAAMEGGTRWLDVCSGTGEMAVCLRRIAGPKTMVVAADFCIPMIQRATAKAKDNRIMFTLANAAALPFPDRTFDLVTISFATRNINVNRRHLVQCIREFHRIIRPGGVFVNLETSQPSSILIRGPFLSYIRLFVGSIGYIISGSKVGYRYLSHTISRFYGAGELVSIIREAGFVEISYRRMTFGIAAIHRAVK